MKSIESYAGRYVSRGADGPTSGRNAGMTREVKMNRAIGRAIVLPICASIVCLPGAAGHAEPKVGDRIGDWTFQCRAVSANKNVCSLNQTLVDKETRQPRLALTLRRIGSDRKLALFVMAPLGVFLAAGIAGKVDEGKQFDFAWQRCTRQGCQAAAIVDAELEGALKAGARLRVAFKLQPSAEFITYAASLKGVTQGLTAIDAD